MRENITEIIAEMQSCKLHGPELEDKEFLVLQELCGLEDNMDISTIVHALSACGTILSVPVLCAFLKNGDQQIHQQSSTAIKMIRKRAKAQGSFLPDEFYTPGHWRSEWLGSKSAFLTYVQVIADIYITQGYDENEVLRIGQILTEEMEVDIAPFQTFVDFRICQTDWDHKAEYQAILDKINEEKLFNSLEKDGISQSDFSFLSDLLMDLQYDYLIARLRLKGNLEYYRFILKIAESLNQPES